MSFQYSAAIDEFMFKISAWVNSESIEYRKRFRSIQSASGVGDEMGATLTHQLLGDMKAAHEVMEDFLWSGDESRYRVVRGGVEVSDSQRIQELELTLCKRVQSAYIETLNKLGQTHESRDALINLLNLLSNDFKQCLELVGGVPDTPERTIVMSPTEVLSHKPEELVKHESGASLDELLAVVDANLHSVPKKGSRRYKQLYYLLEAINQLEFDRSFIQTGKGYVQREAIIGTCKELTKASGLFDVGEDAIAGILGDATRLGVVAIYNHERGRFNGSSDKWL